MIGALIAKSKVTSSYDFLNRRDIKSFLANWHDEATWIYPAPILRWARDYRNLRVISESSME